MAAKKTTTPTPETPIEAAPKGLLVKLISIEYGRKINLETVSKHRPFESAERCITMWADIDPDEQGDPNLLKLRIDELHETVKQAVIASIQETVANVRAADQSLKYSSIAIEKGLDALLAFLFMDGKNDEVSLEQARDIFNTELKRMQEFTQSQ